MFRSRFRVAAVAVAAAVVALAAGCSSSGTPAATSLSATGAAATPTVSANVGKTPTLTVPAGTAPASAITKIIVKGDGAPVAKGDLIVANDYGRTWASDKAFEDSFKTGGLPITVPQGLGQVMKGLDSAFIGTPLGSRVLVVLPPADAFGDQGAPSFGIGKDDTIVLVFDLLAAYPAGKGVTGTMTPAGAGLPTVAAAATATAATNSAKGPQIAIPQGAKAPAKLSSTTLIKGTGKALGKGDLAAVQYTGVVWRTGKTFDSSWSRGVPASFAVGVGGLIAGWDETLVGAHVGDRLLLVVPPDKGYGPQGGQPDAGIEKDDTLVFVIDILGAFAPNS